jgi:hypothetical protein
MHVSQLFILRGACSMDSRRHERNADALQDFALVTRYLPIVGLTLRASLLVSAQYLVLSAAFLRGNGVTRTGACTQCACRLLLC